MRAVFVLCLTACGASAPPASPPATPLRTAVVRRLVGEDDWHPRSVGLEPLPAELALLDVDPEPVDWRWPLPRAPQLIPSGDLAGMFGITGEWTSLCTSRRNPRGVDRDEALAYLRAWCDAPPDLALAMALAPLVGARSPALAAAATIDLATVLETQLAAPEALAWLRIQEASQDGVLDALAATYLATDRLDDTRTVVTALEATRSTGALACRRQFRKLLVVDRSRRDELRRALAVARDAVCTRLAAHAMCPLSWGTEASGKGAEPARIDLDRCTPLLLDHPEWLQAAYLTIAVAHWPREARSFEAWLAFAQFTLGAVGAPRADELIAAAFANAIRLSNCEDELDRVVELVARSSLPRVRQLARLTRAECQRQQGTPPR